MPSTARTESDSFGPIEVPDEHLWGAQTQRSIDNFPIATGPRLSPGKRQKGMIQTPVDRFGRLDFLDLLVRQQKAVLIDPVERQTELQD